MIFEKLKNQNYNFSILKKMLNISQKRIEKHISTIKKSKNLVDFLNTNFFDYKYTSKEFILKLAEITKLDTDRLLIEIEDAEKIRDKLKELNKCHLRVTNQINFTSFFSAMGILSVLSVKINSYELLNKNEEAIIRYIGKIIRKHYKYATKKLKDFIKIKGYKFECLDKIYYFDIEGNLLKKDKKKNIKK